MKFLSNLFGVLCVTTLLMASPHIACAQGNQPQVHWIIEVLQDGQCVDRFEATTAIGQTKSETHKRSVAYHTGCDNPPTANFELSRMITVSPAHIDTDNVVLSIDVQEILEDNRIAQTRSACALPPQLRTIIASHPGLAVPTSQTVRWELIHRSPQLVYRVHANLTYA